jgi:hypothetical protein
MTEALNNREEHESGDMYYLSYINRTIAAAKTLGIEIFKDWEIPSYQRNSLWAEYQEFNTALEHYLVQVQIIHSRRVRGYSVQLDSSTKSKIRHYLGKIREIVDRLEVPPPKKEALSENHGAFRRGGQRQNSLRCLCRTSARSGGNRRGDGAETRSTTQVSRQHRRSSGVRKAG